MSFPMTFLEAPWRLSMGLNTLDLDDWLQPDDRHAAEIAERSELLRERLDDVHAMLPGSEAAAAETLALVIGWLERRAPELLERAVVDRDDALPLRVAGHLVQEDLCVMQPVATGDYALTAAVLCFPAHWSLRAKLGLPMRAIHEPVAGFGQRLAGPADRFMAALDVARPVWRANWSIVGRDALHQPSGSKPVLGLRAEDAGERLYLRVERQTLRRLPVTRAVLFTIRTHVRRLAEIATPPVALALAARLREIDPEMARYKGLHRVREPLLDWLDQRCRVGG